LDGSAGFPAHVAGEAAPAGGGAAGATGQAVEDGGACSPAGGTGLATGPGGEALTGGGAGARPEVGRLVARVLPDVSGFERELDYEVPPELAGEVRAGTVVRVPLQGRRVRGWVLAYPVPPTEGLALRPVAKVTGWGPEPELLDLASWAAWRWAGRRRSLLMTASPLSAVRRLPAKTAAPLRPVVAPLPAPTGGEQPRTKAAPGATVASLVEEAWGPGVHLLRLPPVYRATEVVMVAAEHGPVVVVAPTTARAVAGCVALRNRGVEVALVPDGWAQARAGAQVVIGARAAVWASCRGLSALVVLDAHDEGLVQETAPTWDAASVAAERARRANVPCFWATPCPTLELLTAAQDVQLPSRDDERSGWARLQVVDRRHDDPRQGLYSSALVEVLRSEKRVVCVLNRKGRALLPICGACGEPATCEQCGAGVGLVGDELVCRRCGLARPIVCGSCGSDALRQFRVGVSRAREQLEALAGRPVGEVVAGTHQLPDVPVLVGTEAVLYREGELRRGGPIGVVAFLDFDQELLAPRYRAAEEALALLARASRIVGGRQPGRTVLLQTRAPAHPVIDAALLADPGRLTAAEEPVRKALRLPPYAALALLSGPGAAELAGMLAQQGASHVSGFAQPITGGVGDRRDAGFVDMTGLSSALSDHTQTGAIELVEVAEERWVVRAPDAAGLADALAAAGRPAARVRVEVGPVRF
jgi:primosomal protein N' (replication factor Y) (superfamily II helicase)